MALAFLKTVYDWSTGNDMPEDLRNRQAMMERRHEERHTVAQPRSKKAISTVPELPTIGDEEISDEDERQQLAQRNHASRNSSLRKKRLSSGKFDNILEVQRRSFVGDFERDDDEKMLVGAPAAPTKILPSSTSCTDDHQYDEEMKTRGQFSDSDQDDADDESTKEKNASELNTLKEIVAGGSSNIDSSWTDRPRTYKWIQKKQEKLENERKKAENEGKTVKEMVNEPLMAPALRLKADAAKKLQRSTAGGVPEQKRVPTTTASPSSSPITATEKQQNAQKRANIARQLQQQKQQQQGKSLISDSSKTVVHEEDDDDFLKGIEEEGASPSKNKVSPSATATTSSSTGNNNQNNDSNKHHHDAEIDDDFAIEDDDGDDSLHFDSDADSE